MPFLIPPVHVIGFGASLSIGVQALSCRAPLIFNGGVRPLNDEARIALQRLSLEESQQSDLVQFLLSPNGASLCKP